MADLDGVREKLGRIVETLQQRSTRSQYTLPERRKILDAASSLRERLVKLERQGFDARTRKIADALDEIAAVSGDVQAELDKVEDLVATLGEVAALVEACDRLLAM